jgi:serine/threonine protein kinase/tetratricopeptide (TPR) repeat protein
MVGVQLGRFRILEKIGQGGMASVWKARDDVLGREVAIKVLTESEANSPASRRRFLREARAVASLHHPGLAAIYDVGEHQERLWIAMALIDGITIADRLDRGPLEIDEALRIVADAADALHHAHEHGLIHRDVTSRNLMIGRDGRVVVLDFGLALPLASERITSTGMLMGTPAYLSPEALRGEPLDARCDVYGLGVVLYECLTRVRPFRATADALGYAIVNETPSPPSQLRPEVADGLDDIVLRALSKVRDQRPTSAATLATELRALRSTLPPAAPEPSRTPQLSKAEARPAVREVERLYLAILPFDGISEDGESAPLEIARGLSDSLANAISWVPGLQIVSRGAEAVDGSSLAGIAQQLGANRIIRGNVRRNGERVRITWALLDPFSGIQLAGRHADGSTGQFFELEDRVAAQILAAFDVSPQDGPTARVRRDPAAREHFVQALGYLQRFDHPPSVNGAIELLERLRATERDDADVLAALGRAYLAKYRITKDAHWESRAAAECERARELAPESPSVRLTLGELRLGAGQAGSALEDFRSSNALRPSAEAWIGIGRAEQALGHADAAEAAYRKALEERPGWWAPHNWLSGLYASQGRIDESLEECRRITELAPDNAWAWSNLATALSRGNRLEEAAEACRRAIALHPSARAFSNLASLCFYLKRHDEAVGAYERAVALEPDDPLAWGHMGSALRLMPGREARAREALERALTIMSDRLERNPEDARGWARLAGWLINLGRRDEAMRAIERALELSPEDVESMVTAAGVFQSFDAPRALSWLKAAVERGYGRDRIVLDPALAPLRTSAEFWSIVDRPFPPS